MQELNLAYHYPIIYWNTACLIVNAGADDQVEENKSTDYGKIATAISNMQKRDIQVSLPFINQADFGFIPDEKNNRIIYALKAINGIGDDVVRVLLDNRPYTSMQDFYTRMIDTGLIKKSQMIQLIKAGAFNELSGTTQDEIIKDYIEKYVVSYSKSLTLQQFNKMMELNQKYHFIPGDLELPIRHKYFKDYVLDGAFFCKNYVNPDKKIPKCGYHDRWYILDEVSMPFFQQYYSEEPIEDIQGDMFVISEKKFLKENKKYIEPLQTWMKTEEALSTYNKLLCTEAYNQYAAGSLSKWEMDSLSIYATQEHELSNLDNSLYGVENFFDMPSTPEIYAYYSRKIKTKTEDGFKTILRDFPKYRITRIAGTVIDKDKNKHMISLLTVNGVVTVKFNKGQFAHYDQQISKQNPDGTKSVLEKSWFKRGNKLLVCGYRSEDQFRAYKYAETAYKHTCVLIIDLNQDGTIQALAERVNVKELDGD